MRASRRASEVAIEEVSGLILVAREQMPVAIERDRDQRMPHVGRQGFRVHSCGDAEAGVGVARILKADRLKFRLLPRSRRAGAGGVVVEGALVAEEEVLPPSPEQAFREMTRRTETIGTFLIAPRPRGWSPDSAARLAAAGIGQRPFGAAALRVIAVRSRSRSPSAGSRWHRRRSGRCRGR